jgi:excisionase family DNA binding protein
MTELDYEAIAAKVVERIQDGTWDRPLLTPKTLAERLDCSERYARKLIADEEIPSFKIGDARKIDPREVDKYLQRKAAPVAEPEPEAGADFTPHHLR